MKRSRARQRKQGVAAAEACCGGDGGVRNLQQKKKMRMAGIEQVPSQSALTLTPLTAATIFFQTPALTQTHTQREIREEKESCNQKRERATLLLLSSRLATAVASPPSHRRRERCVCERERERERGRGRGSCCELANRGSRVAVESAAPTAVVPVACVIDQGAPLTRLPPPLCLVIAIRAAVNKRREGRCFTPSPSPSPWVEPPSPRSAVKRNANGKENREAAVGDLEKMSPSCLRRLVVVFLLSVEEMIFKFL
ncbi:hypothetical protein Ahy_A03g015599 isoform A [Arachis hypogaea]|uniref:Uncharacterized protein n=1 Tax=Arachis hypogaea TaxID=3818 RepID=A0A445E0R6_ARAHY|nr:hypothetical protein Ahy_A03g015599 isoform A [Arachis hypogaea]